MSVVEDPKLTAGLDLLRRTGAQWVQLRYSDDEEPTVWFVVASFFINEHGIPVPTEEESDDSYWETAAGHDVVQALMRLCEKLIDGGMCTHCGKLSAFTADFDPVIAEEHVCWTQWDPELAKFRRGCEGDAP